MGGSISVLHMEIGPVIVIPGAPLLVPQLVGGADPDAQHVRAQVLAAGVWLGARCQTWSLIGPDGAGPFPSGVGTFRGFGADVRVTVGPDPDPDPDPVPGALAPDPDPEWPLPLLIAAWLRGRTAPGAHLVPAADAPVGAGTVVVVDGPNTLTARAPGGHRPQDVRLFERQVAAVCGGGAVGGLDTVWRAAAARTGGAAREQYRGAPFGVGYLVATFDPAGAA